MVFQNDLRYRYNNKRWMYYFIIGLLSALMTLGSCGNNKPNMIIEAGKSLPKNIDFNFHVKPILSDKCFACHGPDVSKQKGNLRLDMQENAYAALGEQRDHAALVPGKIQKSHAYLRMISTDPETIMPPPASNLSLSNFEIAIIAKWIEQGAKYKPHWSFIKPQKTEPPEVENKSQIKNSIDQFIQKRLEMDGLTLSDPTSKEMLIRRASFDLTGLPPTIGQIDDFLNDHSLDAYDKVIDRLLSSKAYGERMAANWMDVARYADSDGYLDDKHRDFSPWRDWIIKAFNSNMPYDKFATWQLAGDLIPESNQETKLATAFNRLNKRNSEAGIVYEEYRIEYAADRTHTLGKAFMGLSIECARCHDHKYDPISQKDYYGLFGFFNSTFEIGTPVYGPDQTPGPALLLTSEEEQKQIKYLQNKITEQEAKIQDVNTTTDFNNWLSSDKLSTQLVKQLLTKDLVAYYPFDVFEIIGGDSLESPNNNNSSKPAKLSQPVIKAGKKGNAIFINDYNSVILGEKIGWYERTESFSFQLWIYPDTLYEEAAIIWHSEDRRLGLKGYSLTLKNNRVEFIMAHSWPQNALEVTTNHMLPPKQWSQITVTYDGSSKAEGVNIFINGQNEKLTIANNNLYKGILYVYDSHTYGMDGIKFGSRDKFIPFKNGGIDEVKIFKRKLTGLEVLYTYDSKSTKDLIKNSKNKNSQLVNDYFTALHDKKRKELAVNLNKTRVKENKIINTINEIMVMGDLPEPRPTYVLERGVYHARGEQVQPGTPKRIFPFDDSLPKNRYGLAQWLFDPNNPLTARVYVNRIWQMHFGKGIVKTVGDFGNQGNLPSHPELLDWLAIYFQDNHWDIKGLHKVIMTSATYMQSSIISPELIEKDPENILLARSPSLRLSAEMIRDNALAISGLLVDKIGGKSVYPYQPAGLWDILSQDRYKYLQEPGEGLYRRSIYTIWKRTNPPPSMLIFDIADRGVCTVRRTPTNTPLQALVLLNDPQFLEAGRIIAEQILRDNYHENTNLQTAFRLTTGRLPDKLEKEMLDEFYAKELEKFIKNKNDALAFLNTGETHWDEELNPSEIAALGVVVNAIMNTNEGFTRK